MRAQPPHDLAFGVVAVVDHHRAVQVEQHRVATGAHGILQRSQQRLERRARRLVRRPRFGGDRRDDLRLFAAREVEIRGHRRVRVLEARARGLAERGTFAVTERGQAAWRSGENVFVSCLMRPMTKRRGMDRLASLRRDANAGAAAGVQAAGPAAGASSVEHRRVGLRRAGRHDDQHLLGDRLEVGAEMHRALERQDPLLLRLDADVAKHFLVGGLHFLRREHDAHVAPLQDGHRPELHLEALEHRPGAGEFSVGKRRHGELARERRVAGHAGRFAELELGRAAEPERVRLLRRVAIDQQTQHRVARIALRATRRAVPSCRRCRRRPDCPACRRARPARRVRRAARRARPPRPARTTPARTPVPHRARRAASASTARCTRAASGP